MKISWRFLFSHLAGQSLILSNLSCSKDTMFHNTNTNFLGWPSLPSTYLEPPDLTWFSFLNQSDVFVNLQSWFPILSNPNAKLDIPPSMLTIRTKFTPLWFSAEILQCLDDPVQAVLQLCSWPLWGGHREELLGYLLIWLPSPWWLPKLQGGKK